MSTIQILERMIELMQEVERYAPKGKLTVKLRFLPKFCKGTINGKVDKKTLVLGSLVLFVESMDISEEQKQTMKEYIKNEIPYVIDNVIKFKNNS